MTSFKQNPAFLYEFPLRNNIAKLIDQRIQELFDSIALELKESNFDYSENESRFIELFELKMMVLEPRPPVENPRFVLNMFTIVKSQWYYHENLYYSVKFLEFWKRFKIEFDKIIG